MEIPLSTRNVVSVAQISALRDAVREAASLAAAAAYYMRCTWGALKECLRSARAHSLAATSIRLSYAAYSAFDAIQRPTHPPSAWAAQRTHQTEQSACWSSAAAAPNLRNAQTAAACGSDAFLRPKRNSVDAISSSCTFACRFHKSHIGCSHRHFASHNQPLRENFSIIFF